MERDGQLMIGTIHTSNFILNTEPFSKKHQTI